MSAYDIVHHDPEIERALTDSRDRYWKGKPPLLSKRTVATLQKLQENPYNAARSHHLKFDLEGLRAADIMDGWRLMYKVCEECQNIGLQSKYPLNCCADSSHNQLLRVNVVDIDDYH